MMSSSEFERAVSRVLKAPTISFMQLFYTARLDPSRDLRYANLREIDFSRQDLSGCDFTGSWLKGARFHGAKISGATFSDPKGLIPLLQHAADFDRFSAKLLSDDKTSSSLSAVTIRHKTSAFPGASDALSAREILPEHLEKAGKALRKSLSRRQRQDVDDTVQEAVLRALAQLRSQPSNGDLSAWLRVIARNLSRTQFRKQRTVIFGRDISHKVGRLPSTTGLPEDALALNEVDTLFSQLPSDQREALLLIVKGYSYEHVAELSDCAVGTVKSRVNRARSYIAKRYDWCGEPFHPINATSRRAPRLDELDGERGD